MSLEIANFEFEGPLVNRQGVRKQPGLYAILSFANQQYELVEMGESADLQSSLVDEEKLEYWQTKSIGMLTFSVHYSPNATKKSRRQEMVMQILKNFDGDYREFEEKDGAVASAVS